MELKQFIKNVLKDTIEAVEEIRAESSRDIHLDSNKDQRTVEFDIAVTVEDTTSSSGKAGIKIFQVIEGGGDISKELKNSSVSRIKFGVYVDRWTKKEEKQFQVKQNAYNRNQLDPYFTK